ncbi:MAG: hypothetical protein AAF587_45140, partial [Bacteroidota bacterium]
QDQILKPPKLLGRQDGMAKKVLQRLMACFHCKIHPYQVVPPVATRGHYRQHLLISRVEIPLNLI